jgi:hypothetical protein
MSLQWSVPRSVCLCLIVLVAFAAAPARADTFTLYLRDLEGHPLNGLEGRPFGEVQAFKMVGDGDVTINYGVAQTIVSLGDALTDLKKSDGDGRVTLSIDLKDPRNRRIVFVSNRERELPSSVVPFIIDLAKDNRRIDISVPPRRSEAVATPPVFYYYYYRPAWNVRAYGPLGRYWRRW